jgi:hypothetical protein
MADARPYLGGTNRAPAEPASPEGPAGSSPVLRLATLADGMWREPQPG